MGYKNRSAILDFSRKIKPAPKFLFDHTIIIAGQIIGTWRRIVHTKSIDHEFNYLNPWLKHIKNLSLQLINFQYLRITC
jgi:hypothetical protein